MGDDIQDHTERHPLLIWTDLSPGDVVAVRTPNAADSVRTVDTRTDDGLIIWARDDLNDRKMYHFHECQVVRLF